MEPPRIYIITRTSGREHFFYQNFRSVASQTYSKITHLICYDDDETENYMIKYKNFPNTRIFRVEKLKVDKSVSGHFPFNLYLNFLMDQIEEPGWIMFLDDDDLLKSNNSIQTIVDNLDTSSLNQLVLWQSEFPNGRLVPKRYGRKTIPRMGELSMIGFMFHSSFRDRARFTDKKGGDYRFIHILWDQLQLELKWIPEVISKINYDHIRRCGSGLRRDLSFSNVQKKEYNLFLDNKMAKKVLSLKKKKDFTPPASLVLDDDESISFEKSFESSLDPNILKDIQLEENNINTVLEMDQLNTQINSTIQKEEEELENNLMKAHFSPKVKSEISISENHTSQNQLVSQPISQPVSQPVSEQRNELTTSHDGEDASEDMIIHPQIEKLLDLLSDNQQVKVFTVADLEKVVKNAVDQAISNLKLNPVAVTTQVPPKKVAPVVKPPVSKTIIPKTRMNIRERRALKMKQLKELKQEKKAKALKARQQRRQRGRPVVVDRSEASSSRVASQPFTMIGSKALENQLSDLLSKDEVEDISMTLEEIEDDQDDLGNLLTNYAESDNEGWDLDFDAMVDKIWIMNFEGKATELQYKLEEIGFNDIQIFDPNKKKDFWMNMFELLRASQKKGYGKVMVLRDHIHFHKSFVEELSFHMPKIKSNDDWKMIALSASQNLCSKGGMNPDFYLKTYPDLKKGNIRDTAGAQRHWKSHGIRERRFGQRSLIHPDTLAGVSGVICSSKIYHDLPKLQKSRNPREFMIKNYRNSTYAVTPLLALSGMNRMVKMRNRHNLDFYNI